MSIFDLYSKRRNKQLGKVPDVFQYEDIPDALRVQVVHIWRTAFGDASRYGSNIPTMFQFIHDTLCREYGRFNLSDRREGYFDAVANFMLQSSSTDEVLDVIELSFRVLDRVVRENPHQYHDSKQSPDEAISELNDRLKERGVGYQYESGIIIRVDSKLIHEEVIKPALSFLSEKAYAGANQEFLSAHEHYRHQKHKECLNDCLKALESTMKSICIKRKWTYKPTDTAKTLLDTIFSKDLVPSFMQSHFTGLRASLEAGVPTVRNKLGGHGQGERPIMVPEYIASYLLHLTATNIILLIQAEKEIP